MTAEAFPLQALARRIGTAAQAMPFARPLGEVRAVGPSAIEVAGLSRALRLGALVEIVTERGWNWPR